MMVKNTTRLTSLVRVNRGVQLLYPNGMRLIDQELSNGGPPEYDLSELEPWLHRNQRDDRSEKGSIIYEHLRITEGLSRCLGLQDGLALKEKGIVAFRKFFGDNKALPLWRSVVRHTNGILFVPCVFRDGSNVVIGWHSMNSQFCSQDVTFKFPPTKNKQGRFCSEKAA